MRAVLGIRLGPMHDTGAALVYEEGGELRAVAIAEARLSRVKHSRAFPRLAIEACLAEVGVSARDLDAIVFEKNTLDNGVRGIDPVDGRGWPHFDDAEERDFFARLDSAPTFTVNHHLAHAATAWHTTPWPEDGKPGAVLVVDGRGTVWEPDVEDDGPTLHVFPRNPDLEALESRRVEERLITRVPRRAETQSVFLGRGRRLTREAVSLRSGAGFLYAWATQMVLGFAHMHAGKSMGLAAYGDPASGRFPPFPDAVFDGIDTDFAQHLCDHSAGGLDFQLRRPDEDPTSPYFADAAAWAQHELTRAVLHLSRYALERTGAARLGYAGGVALNVVANRTIHDVLRVEGALEDLFVQPAASDEGLALGAALVGYYDALGGRAPFQRDQVYLGPSASAPKRVETPGFYTPGDLSEAVAELLLDGKIVGWVQGRSEHGPRALGARSILCWPRPAWMKDHLNLRVKHREAFRPFAPIALDEHAREVFDLPFASPHMLFHARVRDEFRDRLPAVTHADGSARLQTVSRETTPALASLLDAVRRRDGVGVLLNTSFNDNNEPIVETVADALDCFHRTGLDALICGESLLVPQPAPGLP